MADKGVAGMADLQQHLIEHLKCDRSIAALQLDYHTADGAGRGLRLGSHTHTHMCLSSCICSFVQKLLLCYTHG